jgi:hypothetical protein
MTAADQPAGAAAAVVLSVEFAFRDGLVEGCQHLAGQPLSLGISRTVHRGPLTCSDGAHSLHHLVMTWIGRTVASLQLSGSPR